MRMLLHICCGPCAVTVEEGFTSEGYTVDMFFYNPNIHPYLEHKARLESARVLAGQIKGRLIEADGYEMPDFLRMVAPHPPSRCSKCYQMRLSVTAKTASELGYDAFSTTLSVSPYQDHDLLRSTGESVGVAHGITYIYHDFRTSFRQGQARARALGLYMQKYCGCVYSEAERYQSQAAR